MAGFAGSLRCRSPERFAHDVHWSMSGEIVLMRWSAVWGTVFGPRVGAFVIIAMQQYLAGFGMVR